jgi:hypothetical protein
MSEIKIEKKKIRGFAGLIENIMLPLNENPNFKVDFKNTVRKFLINAPNLNYAALVSIDKGHLKVESVENKQKSNLSKNALGWDGFISMDSQIFLVLALDRISIVAIGLKWLTGKVKMKGIRKLLTLLKVFSLLKELTS